MGARLPVLPLTFSEYYSIPKAENMPNGFFLSCEFGTRFRCSGSGKTVDSVVIGEVVKWEDAIMSQWGSGLCPPKHGRFVNRYIPVISEQITDYQI